ncbi:hypothetical protein GA0070604_0146 [Micromonospora eburnea]|uniref:Uncharacterized protein n=2 Tax=Micromonospora eburnea TaxID=227316 RepID=A0A1C6TPP4_9ACTN|nr:hypothetical protein GA0070604_0014 [Micromonospora eburnea]SCL44017.1 hypothetical protein GA0070604_0146 [Micromonospora eburnea]
MGMMSEGRWTDTTTTAATPPIDRYELGLLHGGIDSLESVLELINMPGADIQAVVRALLKDKRDRAAGRGVR